MKQVSLLMGFMLLSLVSLAQYTGTLPVTLSGLPSGATSIQWYKDGVAISGANTATYNATAAGQYYAAYTDATTSCAVDKTVPFVLLNSGSSVVLNGSTNNTGTAYQWYNAGTAVSGATAANYTATTGGLYYLQYNNGSCVIGTKKYYVFILTATPTLSVAATDANKAEGNSGTTAYTFTVTRADNTTGTTTVDWAVTGSGTNPANAADFGGTLPSGTVTFAAGETSKVITVNVSGDVTLEPNETFTITLSNPSGGASLTTATATGTIQNDDAASPLIANNPTQQTATVGQAKSGSAATDLAPTGGTIPYIYSNGTADPACTPVSGATALPASSNLTVNASTGAYTYTAPSIAGTYYFCIKVCDSATPTPSCVVKTYTVIVTASCNAGTAAPALIKN